VALVAVLAFVVLAGCGLEGQPFTTTEEVPKASPEPADTLVTPEALADIPENSLRGVVLRWWRGLQTRDPKAVIDSYAPDVRDELPNKFADVVVIGISPPAAESSIRINSLEPTGDGEATVYLTIYSSDPRMDGPLALPMKKVDDEWRINDVSFLNAIAETFIAAMKAATGEGGQ
jgi:hypothetical protein